MDKVKKGLSNQAIGFMPLLLFMYLDNYFSYMLSFIIGFAFCFVCLFFFQTLARDKIYQFSLIPTAIVFILYSIFLALDLESISISYATTLITEILLVVTLACIGFTRRIFLFRIRNTEMTTYKRTVIRTGLNEFYFICQIFQNVFSVHLFILLIYNHLEDISINPHVEQFLYRELPLLLGLGIMIYEQIRISLMRGNLKKEMWLPVLNDKGRVIGSMARSVSRTATKKYYHPIVRIAVVYKGMLYLVKRGKSEFVSPELIDYPFTRYVLFRHSIESTVKDEIRSIDPTNSLTSRFLIRYTFENAKVKHLVSLYVVNLKDEAQLGLFHGGKLWTAKQIEDNLESNVFSEYFEKEFPYLQNTILLAERVCMGDEMPEGI